MRWVAGLLLAAAPALAGGFWNKKPFPGWSRQQVIELLTRSPWAESETVLFDFREAGPQRPVTWKDLGVPGNGQGPTITGGSPVGGIGAPKTKDKIEAQINVRWSSALPVRQATALTKFGREGLEEPGAKELLEDRPKFYVLEISGVPAAVAYSGIPVMQADLYRDLRLVTGRGRAIRPESVYITPKGATLNIAIRFRKHPPITLKDKTLEIRIQYDLLKIKRKWKLREMVYRGKLEL